MILKISFNTTDIITSIKEIKEFPNKSSYSWDMFGLKWGDMYLYIDVDRCDMENRLSVNIYNQLILKIKLKKYLDKLN